MASGLLAQSQGLARVGSNTNQSTATASTSSWVQQCSGDVTEAEDISECSQGSILGGSTSTMANAIVLYAQNETQPPEYSDSSKITQQCFSHDWLQPSDKDWQVSSNELQKFPSLDISDDAEFINCIDVDPIQSCVNFSASTSTDNMIRDDFSRVIYPPPEESYASENLCKCPNENQVDGSSELVNESTDGEVLNVDATANSQSYYSDLLLTSCYQSIYMPLDSESYHFNIDNQQLPVLAHNGQDNAGTQNGQGDQVKDSLEVVPTDASNLAQLNDIQNHPSVEKDDDDTGVLSYDPPRFPSLDIPFFSCDLVQYGGGDMQHEYSPLGIRKLMMSSMNCFSPYRLWDSPSRADSPEAVLKTAAKTFTCTPSILKKRNRDLCSPLSEKRCEKKLECSSFSNLARDFSRLEVMFDENMSQQSPSLSDKQDSGPFLEDKENVAPVPAVADEETEKRGVDGTILKVSPLWLITFYNFYG